MLAERDSAMTRKEIRVGIVGANANGGWAKLSHAPAINAIQVLKLAAVATRNQHSAREAAEAFGADRWFSDPFAMIHDDLIDVITISVKLPAQREMVLAAISAGKVVYCEAPLGRSIEETEVYAHLVRDLRKGTNSAPGFGHALHNARLIDAVRRAAERGKQQQVS